MRFRSTVLSAFFILCSVWLTTPRPGHASPTDCDNLCRLRQYSYWPQNMVVKYRKYEQPTCIDCQGFGAICVKKDTDQNVTDPQVSKAINYYSPGRAVSSHPRVISSTWDHIVSESAGR